MTNKREKLRLKKEGARKCAVRQHIERRRQLKYEIAIFSIIEGITLYDLFSSREAFEIENADLFVGRAVFRRAAHRRRVPLLPAAATPIAITQVALALNRPTATLSRQNRSWVAPDLSFIFFAEDWSALGKQVRQSTRPAAPFSRRPDAHKTRAGDLPSKRNGKSHSDEADRTKVTVDFWQCYREGRTRYDSAYRQKALEEDSVGLFHADELKQLLPDVIVPRVHSRAAYVTNLLWDIERLCLDLFCAATLRPLCRHYFASPKVTK